MPILQPKELLANFDPSNFTFLCSIGKGSFGEVHKCIHIASSLTLAIKIIDLEKADDEIDDIRKEISFHGQCEHPNITTYYNSRIVGSSLWILMEFLGGGSALDLLKLGIMEEVYIATIIREILKGLAYLHDENKIHRDIKCANILLSDVGEVKLADFGVAGQLTQTLQGRNTFVGTPFWMAPEVIKQSKYDSKADIWSLGITVVELACGHPPHHELHPMKALFSICKENPPELDEKYSKHIRDFCSLCLQRDPTCRQSARLLLKHRFLKFAKKPSILTDLIEKFRMQNISTETTLSTCEEPDESTPNVEFPDWEFGTVKIVQPLNAFKIVKSFEKIDNLEVTDVRDIKILHMKSNSCGSAENKSFSDGDSANFDQLNTSAPTDVLRPRSPSTMNGSSIYSCSDEDKSRLKKSRSGSKRIFNSNYSKKDSARADNQKLLQTVSLFNAVVQKVATENDVECNVISEFMANFSDKTIQLAEFYSTILKLANDTKRFNSNVKK